VLPLALERSRTLVAEVEGGLWISKSQSSASGSGSEEIACPSISASSTSSLDFWSSLPSFSPLAVNPNPEPGSCVAAEGGVVDCGEGSSRR
jgi:hypothetical protein